jgi:hypothetical protein
VRAPRCLYPCCRARRTGRASAAGARAAGDAGRDAPARRHGAVTHSFNHSQRYVGLAITGRTAASVTCQAPPDGNVAPPGHYLLFLLNGVGVPAVAPFVQLR